MTDLLNGSNLTALMRLPGIGARRAAALAAAFTGWDDLRATSEPALAAVLGPRLAAATHPHLCEPLTPPDLPEGVRVISCFEQAYPARLLTIPEPPALLWIHGTLPPDNEGALAVVGTRHPSQYGTAVAARASAAAAHRNLSHISGLAHGVDLVGAAAALDAGGRSWAVLGCGVDQVGSSGVRAEVAARVLASGGGLIAEVPPGTPTAPHLLTRRNRLQSGLADAVLVAQSGLPGPSPAGTMHTARYAVEQHRALVVPRPRGRWASEDRSAGNLALTDPDGCDPASLYATGALARVIAARKPVADVVLRSAEDLTPMWADLDAARGRTTAHPRARGAPTTS